MTPGWDARLGTSWALVTFIMGYVPFINPGVCADRVFMRDPDSCGAWGFKLGEELVTKPTAV